MLSVVALGTVAFSSCTKDDDNNVAAFATITANIDGTLTTFDKNVSGVTGSLNGSSYTSIQATDDKGNTLMIKLTGEVNAGKIFASNAANDADKPVVKYTTANGSAYLTNNGDISNIVKVAVSVAKSNNIQGTFNGTLTGSLDSQDPVFGDRAITNGKFNITLDS